MVENVSIGGDGAANYTLSVFRIGDLEGDLSTSVEFLPGFELHADPSLELSGHFRSPVGRLLELDARTGPNSGDWVGLHLHLPSKDLGTAGIVGFAARIAAPEIVMVRACLRSGTEEGFVDCFFEKHLLFRSEESSHLDAIAIQQRENVPIKAPWREIVFFLPSKPFRLSYVDLRVFVV